MREDFIGVLLARNCKAHPGRRARPPATSDITDVDFGGDIRPLPGSCRYSPYKFTKMLDGKLVDLGARP